MPTAGPYLLSGFERSKSVKLCEKILQKRQSTNAIEFLDCTKKLYFPDNCRYHFAAINKYLNQFFKIRAFKTAFSRLFRTNSKIKWDYKLAQMLNAISTIFIDYQLISVVGISIFDPLKFN